MYEEKFIAFIDILGFGSLVEASSQDQSIPEKILAALKSIQPEAIHQEAYARINKELIPPGELERVMEVYTAMTAQMRKMIRVTITYFSDSLVISAPSDDIISSQMLLDMLAKLSIKLWEEHSLLIRGGITIGKLIHIENGPLFGPTMNRAYHLESKLAKNPRILMDASCIEAYRKIQTFELFESYLQQDGEFYYASLATAYRHIINDSSLALAGEKVLEPFRRGFDESHQRVNKLIESANDEGICSKFSWLSQELKSRLPEIRPVEPDEPIIQS